MLRRLATFFPYEKNNARANKPTVPQTTPTTTPAMAPPLKPLLLDELDFPFKRELVEEDVDDTVA